MENQFKYFAFISYSSKDIEWGKRLQKKLENYRMPATLCSERGWGRTPIKPVFFAPTDIQGGGLSAELQKRLRDSQNLIVICSPNSAKSQWVGKEIAFFHQLGRTKQIHFFIVDGVPNSGNEDTECFNPIIKDIGLPEILGANIHERTQTYPFTNISWPWMDKQRAYVQLISKLLNVEFDSIWQRHKRQLIEKAVAWTIGIIVVLATLIGVWITNQPIEVGIKLNEASVHNNNLPQLKDAVITLTLDNETKTDTIKSIDSGITFTNIPHRYLGKDVKVSVKCKNFLPVDTTLKLTENMSIDVQRNPDVYGSIHFKLWNPDTEQISANTEVTVDGNQVTSDTDGYITLTIPLSEQKVSYPVSSSSITLIDSIIHLPCGEDDVITFK